LQNAEKNVIVGYPRFNICIFY